MFDLSNTLASLRIYHDKLSKLQAWIGMACNCMRAGPYTPTACVNAAK